MKFLNWCWNIGRSCKQSYAYYINLGKLCIEIGRLCKKFGFTRQTLPKHKEDFRNLVTEYFNSNPEFLPHKKGILGMVKYLLE